MTPGGLRAQYLIPNLTPKCECLSIHSSLPFEPRHHAIPRNQRKQSLCRTETNCRPQAPLPNLLEKIFPHWAGFVTDSGPQISPSLIPIFGVNSAPRPGSSSRGRVPSRPRRSRERATDRGSDGGVAVVRAATEGEDHSGIFAVTPPSPTNPKPPIKAGLFPLHAPSTSRRPPLPPPPWARAPARARHRPTTPLDSLDPSAAHKVACCPAKHLLAVSPEPPRQPPPAAFDPPHR
jgi:hypothetical protein